MITNGLGPLACGLKASGNAVYTMSQGSGTGNHCPTSLPSVKGSTSGTPNLAKIALRCSITVSVRLLLHSATSSHPLVESARMRISPAGQWCVQSMYRRVHGHFFIKTCNTTELKDREKNQSHLDLRNVTVSYTHLTLPMIHLV